MILSDARDLAGSGGEMVLLHVIPSPSMDQGTGRFMGRDALKGSEAYLESVAAPLRAQGFRVKKRSEVRADVSASIDDMALEYEADMIVLATHGPDIGGRMLHGEVTWSALANSCVPLFLRHVKDEASAGVKTSVRAIMLPLDGSHFSEKAIPVAQELSLEWSATLWLVRVVQQVPVLAVTGATRWPERTQELEQSEAYLKSISSCLSGEVRTSTRFGSVCQCLTEFVQEQQIGYVVIASHGRTGLSRVIHGSVADDLTHQLECGIVVVPALACGRLG